MADATPTTVDAAILQALDAYERLQALAEDVDDEWMYVQDLVAAHRARLEAIAAEDGDARADPVVGAAVEAACGEIGRITDPHRAIDWLSTFPSVVALALGREP
jgi:hypothetical protein